MLSGGLRANLEELLKEIEDNEIIWGFDDVRLGALRANLRKLLKGIEETRELIGVSEICYREHFERIWEKRLKESKR